MQVLDDEHLGGGGVGWGLGAGGWLHARVGHDVWVVLCGDQV